MGAGLVLTILGVILIFFPAFFIQQTFPGGTDTASKELRVEYLEKRNYTYVLEQGFLIRNPFDNNVTDLVYVWVPVNTSHQTAILLESSLSFLGLKASGEGTILVYNITLPGEGSTWLNVTLRVIVESYRLSMMNMPWLNPSDVENNTGGKRYWAVDNQTYVLIAREIGLEARDPVGASREIGSWILDHLDYRPTGLRKGAEYALTLEGGRLVILGDCEEVADVFVTLNRILGIRARVAQGLYLLEDADTVTMYIRQTDTGFEYSDNWGGHAWPQIYVPGAGWVDVELMEYKVVKVGDFSERHVKYRFEERSFLGSRMMYCQSMYFETSALYFTFRRMAG
ncbi:MAG: transglutaminase-like domain-containing protein [Thermoproteota archaeon]